MTAYLGSRNADNGDFYIREVPHIPPTDARKQPRKKTAIHMPFRDLYRICLALGIAAPSSEPVTREVATAALTARLFDADGLEDHEVQRIYDLHFFKRAELAQLMECYLELHDMMEA